MSRRYIKFILWAVVLFSGVLSKAQTPGGVNNANYTWQVWLTPDGYNYPTGVWTNKITTAGTAGNFSAVVNRPAKLNTGGYNFHPSVEFTKSSATDASKRLANSINMAIANGDNITSIFVFKRANSTSNDYLFSFNDGNTSGDLVFYTNNSDDLTLYWLGTSRGVVLTAYEGIATVDNANNATNQAFGYVNGAVGTGITTVAANCNSRWALGASGSAGSAGFEGVIQEVIILKASGTNNHIDSKDLQQIHSYLAIKYGITLNNAQNYFNSAGNTVWDRGTNAGFNNHIFGIGRDNAAGLNQVQSVSQTSDMLTVYKGAWGTNNDNGSNQLGNLDFLMLGTNDASGITDYVYPPGTVFNGTTATIDKINYRSNFMHRAQVTTAGALGGSQTVNVKITSGTARYVIVSSDPNFPIGITRIYPVSGLTATGVVINNGDYIATAGYQPTPGGSHDVTFGIWLTPDSYRNGVWTNRIGGAVGDFTQRTTWSQKTAPATTVGANFNPAVLFRATSSGTALNRLQSANGINLQAGDAHTFLIVYKATNAGFAYQNILQFQGGANVAAAYNGTTYSLSYITSGSPVLSEGWTTTARTLGSVPFGKTAIVTVDNNNTGANGIRHYLNGTQIATAASQNGAVNNSVILGASWYDITGNGERGVNADIQEVIMLKRPRTTFPFLADVNAGADLMKIQSYLAIKYGITLSTDYMATDGTVVWNAAANSAYNKWIVGIGRDDETGLFQKQSISVDYNGRTFYIGNKVETLNSQNAGTLNDKEYIVLGSNGLNKLSGIYIAGYAQYVNDIINVSTGMNFQNNLIYKAQLTNLTSKIINIKLLEDYYDYALVSEVENFDPLQTKIYPVSNKVATVEVDANYKYIKFVGYEAGPGGVNVGLKLWLHADNETSLDVQPMTYTGQTSGVLGYFPSAVTNIDVPTVQSWTDEIRDQTYAWPSSPAGSWRTPVYEPDNLMMNFKPSVRFWGSGTTYGTYLYNSKGIGSKLSSYPWNPDGHTAYFVIAGNFSTGNRWIYQMGFGGTFATVPSPGYGVQYINSGANNGNMVGRIRSYVNGGGDTGDLTSVPSNNLFTKGATAINGYYQTPPRTSAPNLNMSNIYFRFNGRQEITDGSNPFNYGHNLNQTSFLGSSVAYDRTVQGVISEAIIFDHELTSAEQRQVESYLAIKYGITLRPSNTTTNRFDYILSNGTKFWRGDAATSDPIYGKYATFYNNVAAVIRDDAAKLNNPQSHSTDVGSLLHMGVAGTRLGSKYDVSELPNNLEVIAWGSDNGEGVTRIPPAPCVPFENIFNRKWLVHKQTKDDRPLAMIVGAEDNSQNELGANTSTTFKTMYTALMPGNDIYLIVADTPEQITPGNPAYGNFKAVVPMRYIDGEQQCIYTFKDSVVYVTFGYKPNKRGCYGDVQFEGSKIYSWNTQWTRANYNLNGVGAKTITKPVVDLEDGVTVTTQVTYDNSVRANTYYPRFATNPRNYLDIQRRNGTQGVSKVTITITFNTPVVPQFSISGIDTRSRLNDRVTITGSCPGGAAIPTLMYAGTEKNATYTIQGNRAVANKNRSAAPSNVNGKMNVMFEGGVTTLVIEYIIDSRRVIGSSIQDIFIGPITITNVLPPPVYNEDGLSFTKQAMSKSITTCETMEYTFRIGNINNVDKYVDFTDILPNKMKWVAESVSFDSINSYNTSIVFNDYGRTNTLKIDSVLVPCASEIKFKATADMDEDAESDTYSNKADITYEQEIGSSITNQALQSQDAETLEPLTDFYASWAERQDTVTINVSAAPSKYSANREILVTLKVNNPNMVDITDMFIDITWDAGFSYVVGSWNYAAGSTVAYVDDMSLLIAGLADGSEGFTLSNGETIFTFKLLAPTKTNLEYVIDEATGLPTNDKLPLTITYDFSSTMDDPCIIRSMSELSDMFRVPYGGREFIITNKNITVKIKR